MTRPSRTSSSDAGSGLARAPNYERGDVDALLVGIRVVREACRSWSERPPEDTAVALRWLARVDGLDVIASEDGVQSLFEACGEVPVRAVVAARLSLAAAAGRRRSHTECDVATAAVLIGRVADLIDGEGRLQ